MEKPSTEDARFEALASRLRGNRPTVVVDEYLAKPDTNVVDFAHTLHKLDLYTLECLVDGIKASQLQKKNLGAVIVESEITRRKSLDDPYQYES